MTPEELLVETLKQSKKIVFGETIGTDTDGNCTVQSEDGSILARSPDQISAGSCVALKTDTGQWYAVSARQSGTVAKKDLFKRKNKPPEESIITSTSFLGVTSAKVAGIGDEVFDIFAPDTYYVADTNDASRTNDSYEFYAMYVQQETRNVRFSHIQNNEEIRFKEISSLDNSFYGEEIAEGTTRTRISRGILSLGVIDGFFVFAKYSLTIVDNYNNENFDTRIGYMDSSVTAEYGFVDLNNETFNSSFSTVSISLDRNNDMQNPEDNVAAFGSLNFPVPPPINSILGRFTIFTFRSESEILITYGTSDLLIAGQGDYLLLSSYDDFALRFYEGDTYISRPSAFIYYDMSKLPPRKGYFLNAKDMQITANLEFIKLLGITKDDKLLYVIRTLDEGFGDIQELELNPANIVEEDSYYVGYINTEALT